MADYYKILGLNKDASSENIRRAYRLKAKQFHPDINKGADAKILFQQINEAYHFLIDIDKRRFYDFKLKQDITLYKKYGKNYQDRYKTQDSSYKTNNNEGYQSYSYYTSYTRSKSDVETDNIIKKFNLYTDNFLFYIMLFIGFITIIFGIKDLFLIKWKGPENVTGILFGLSYTSILLYWWYLRKKTKK